MSGKTAHEDDDDNEHEERREDRHADRGRAARAAPALAPAPVPPQAHPRRIRAEHTAVGSLIAVLAALPIGGKIISGQVDSQSAVLLSELKSQSAQNAVLLAEVRTQGAELKVQGAQIADLKLAVIELKGQVAQNDKVTERVLSDLERRIKVLEDEQRRSNGGK